MNVNSQSGKMYDHRPSRTPAYLLPGFYAKAIFKPSARTFTEACEYAKWHLVWLQLAILIAIPVVLGLLRGVFRDRSTGIDTITNPLFGLLSAITVGATIGATILKIILVPILFFIGVSLQYALARIFRGRGHYVEHGFSMLLYEVPLTLIGSIIIAIFVILHLSTLFYSPVISMALFLYGVYINVFVVMGVHAISRSKAIATVIIPYVIGGLAICGALAALANYIARSISTLH